MTNDQQQAMEAMLDRVRAERLRQHELYGEQDYHDDNFLVVNGFVSEKRKRELHELDAAADRDDDHANDDGSWITILASEYAEVCNATDDPTHLQEELIQLAAVCVQWAEAIERRKR